MRELIKEIWSTSKRNKLRTSLTGFAVAWGIFMLIFLLGAGNGLINAQLQQSTRFLANSMRVFPGETSKAYKGLKEGRSITLNDKDILISNQTYGQYVDDVGGRLEQYNVNINYGDNYVASQSLVGVAPTHPKIDKTELIAGRFINEIDMKEQRKNVVLSRSQAKELCKDYRSLVGKNVKISNLNFQVVGIYKDDESRNNTDAFTAYSTVKIIYAKGADTGAYAHRRVHKHGGFKQSGIYGGVTDGCIHDFGFGDEGTGDGYTLLLSSRHLVRIMVGPLLQAQFFEIFHRQFVALLAAHALVEEWKLHVFHRRLERDEVERLEDEANHLVAVFGSTGF
jgi:hypothetical protein